MRLATLSVLGGSLHGRKIDLAPVGAVLIGSDSECQLHLDLPGISPVHARLRTDRAGTTVHDERSPSGVFVNFDRVEREAPPSSPPRMR